MRQHFRAFIGVSLNVRAFRVAHSDFLRSRALLFLPLEEPSFYRDDERDFGTLVTCISRLDERNTFARSYRRPRLFCRVENRAFSVERRDATSECLVRMRDVKTGLLTSFWYLELTSEYVGVFIDYSPMPNC